jgi:transposase
MEAKIEKSQEKVKVKRFKEYDQDQIFQVPIFIEGLIPPVHLVRIVDKVVEGLDMSSLEVYYPGGGSSSYHPKMMIKLWIYGYCERIYTSRRLAKMVHENINYIWLSGGHQPCFKTLSDFRSGKLQVMIDIVFKEVLEMLIDLDYIDLDELYVDGSKWEANGNRHKHVWKKNTERYKSVVIERIEGLLLEIKALQTEEDAKHGIKDLAENGTGEALGVILTSEIVGEHLTRLQSLVSAQAAEQVEKMKKNSQTEGEKLVKKLSEEQSKLIKYEDQEAILGTRNSYSKTDEDATMLRMKDERLLPAYNVEHTTSQQYVTNYTIAQNASDSVTLIPHLEKMAERFEGITELKDTALCADAGYGSEENYAYLEGHGMIAYVKYPMWYQEQTGELAKKIFRRENWTYDKQSNSYTCPNNRKLNFAYQKTDITANGYERTVHIYQSENCKDCPFAEQCKRSEESARTVQHSPQGEVYKEKAKELLDTDKGKEMRKKRSIEVESVFGDIKFNMQHDRFILRGKNKVYVEYGLLAIGHNLRKVYCQQSGIWKDYYAQRAAKKAQKEQKRA